MSTALASPQLTPSMTRGKGVWAAAATRFKTDHVGMSSLVIVVVFLLVVLAAGLGLVAKDWQVERGVPDAPPTFVGPAAKTESIAVAAPTFAAMLLLRFLQGASAAAIRVGMMSAVRDRFAGRPLRAEPGR